MDPAAKPNTPRVVITASALAGALRPDPGELSGDLGAGGPHWPRIPGYRLVRLIGEGGGGRVFEAVREGGSQMSVALKVVRQPLGTSGRGPGMDRVWRELDVLSELRLECVPRVVDWGTVDGRMYIATELVQGEGLQEYCDRSRLKLRERVELLVEVCRAVASVHDALVVHRDLKPSNILVNSKGKPVIVDFGVARLATDEPGETVTVTGEVVGTTPFIAPEVARSQEGALRSVQADVYSLGATAYVILTGQPPREERTTAFERLREAAEGVARDPRTLNSGIPQSLAAVLRKACESNIGRRYKSATELEDDLQRWIEGRPVLARRSRWVMAAEWIARHPVLATATACGALVVASVASVKGYVDYYLQTPYMLAENASLQQAQLLSRAGMPLYRWDCGEQSGVIVAKTARTGGSDVAVGVLGLGSRSLEPSAGALSMFRLDDPAHPFFVSRLGVEHLHRPTGAETTDSYHLRWADVQDVFPEVPGEEVIAVFTENNLYPTCVRVYDTTGKVRFEAWHWGRLNSARWLAGPGVLVLGGVSNRPEVHEATESAVGSSRHMPIVLAVRPRCDAIEGWIDPLVGTKSESLAWYRYLQPAKACTFFDDARVESSHDPERRSTTFRAAIDRIDVPNKTYSIQWDVDASGTFLHPVPNDAYERLRGTKFSLDQFRWSERLDGSPDRAEP